MPLRAPRVVYIAICAAACGHQAPTSHASLSPPPATPAASSSGPQPTAVSTGARTPTDSPCVTAALAPLLTVEPGAATRRIYAIARAHYAAGDFGAAFVLFDEVVRREGASELGSFAAQLALDSLNLLARAPAVRDVCYAAMRERAVAYTDALRCFEVPPPSCCSDACTALHAIACLASAVDAEAQTRALHHAEASASYEAAYRSAACRSSNVRRDELLYNAARAAESAGDVARSDALRAELRRDFPRSPLLAR